MSSEAFVTSCTTCGVRLNVRDAAAVGQIYPCPKCGSMVLVECSAGDAPEAARPGAGATSLADERPAGPAGDQVVTHASGTAGVDLGAANVTRLSMEVPGMETVSIDSSSGLRPADWMKTSGSAARKWLGMTLGCAAGGALVLALIGGGLAEWPAGPKNVSNERAVDPRSAVMDESRVAPNSNSLEALADILPGIPNIDPAPASDDHIQASQPRRGNTGSEPTAKIESSPAAPPSNPKVAEPPPADNILPPGFEPRVDTKRQRLEPPQSFADLASLLAGTAAATVAAELPSASVAGADESLPPPPETVARVASRSSSSDIAGTLDVSARLRVKIRAVQFDKVPLVSFVRSVMRLSGISMQIDPAALRQTGQDAEAAVTYSASDVSVDQLLRQALQPLNLTPVIEGRIVRISSPFWEESQLRQMSFYVGDLQEGKGRDLDLASVISQLIEPDSWSDAGGPGSIRATGELLKVSQTRRVQFQVLILLEKLRLARGLRPQSKIPARYIRVDSRWRQLRQRLARQLDMNAWHPRPFWEVVRQLEEASDIRILVDWQSLARSGWKQDSACTLVARKTSVEEVFNLLLAPRELELRPISDATVQITSASSNAGRPYLEFYSLEELGESGLARLEESLHAPVGSFALDTASDTALVVLPASRHRQLLGP